jgi:hypothetical protein
MQEFGRIRENTMNALHADGQNEALPNWFFTLVPIDRPKRLQKMKRFKNPVQVAGASVPRRGGCVVSSPWRREASLKTGRKSCALFNEN